MRNKVVIITGASSGIGRALAVECARQGARIVLAARRLDRLNELADKLRTSGAETLVVVTDVSKADDCEQLVQQTIAQFGQIDVLINNAGVSMRALFCSTPLSVLQRVMDINFWGTVYCTHFALPWLLQSKGTLVGISSIAGFKGLPGRTAYSASKFAMHGFLEAVRTENMKKDFNVLLVCPGFTSTEIRAQAFNAHGEPQGYSPRDEKKMMKPETVAQKTVQAIIRHRRLLILTLEGKMIIALQRFIPAFLDKRIYRQMSGEADSPFH